MSADWTASREGGGRFALWLIRGICIYLGRPAGRALLYPITLYFFCRRPVERRASRAYLTRVFGRPASSWQVLRHFHCFAATILDRVFFLGDRFEGFDVVVHDIDELNSRVRPGRGLILLGSHLGSFEVLRALAGDRPDIVVRAVLDTGQTPAMTELLHEINPRIAEQVIDASRPGPEIVLAIHAALQAGEVVTLLGDRARPGERVVSVDFLGARANFPVAPFLLAAMLRVPVVMTTGVYRGANRYAISFAGFADEIDLPRRASDAQVRAVVQRYAAHLEEQVRDAPYNWFNWYDFWNVDSPQPAGHLLPDHEHRPRRSAA